MLHCAVHKVRAFNYAHYDLDQSQYMAITYGIIQPRVRPGVLALLTCYICLVILRLIRCGAVCIVQRCIMGCRSVHAKSLEPS